MRFTPIFLWSDGKQWHTVSATIPYTPTEYDEAIRILKNNHWYQDPTRSVWENPSQTQFINESHLLADPKAAISSVGMDWDSEMRALNSAWGGTPSKYKASFSMTPRQGFIQYDDGDHGIDGDGWKMYNPKKECSHEWATYTGFNESYEYCKKCDKKK